MRNVIKARLALFALLFTLVACGETVVGKDQVQKGTDKNQTVTVAALSQKDQDQIKKTLADRSEGQIKPEGILKVSNTPIPGLYEVIVDKSNVFYVDKEINYLLTGELVDMKTKKSMTAEVMQTLAEEQSKVSFATLPLDKAIKEVRGKGQMVVAVFSDPDCPYCKELEKEFAKIDNLTVYTFLKPIDQLHPEADKKSRQIWCSADRAAAWTNWMRKGVAPKGKEDCANPVAETKVLGDKLGFNGTPAMIFPNGKTIMGMLPGGELKKMIEENQK